jgi:catechol 2,3-dioxygenase-like lactoylglutathione lyase family enzyme
MMITGFNHTSFTVADMEKSVKFWTEMLGYEAASVSPREGKWQEEVTGVAGASLLVAHLYGHGHHIEFIQYLGGATPGNPSAPSLVGAAHVALETDDIEATWKALIAAGATPQGRIARVTTGAVAGVKAGYIRDPNGILIELVELAPKK